MTPEDEIWAELEDFPDYAVSTYGRVMNLRTNNILRPRNNSYGYTRVGLRRDGETHDVYIHHLVAKAFISNYRRGVSIRHADDNDNNHINNLRFRKGRRMGTILTKTPKALARFIRVVELDKLFRTVDECAQFIQGDRSSIYRVLNGQRNSHRGYTFEYYYEEQ